MKNLLILVILILVTACASGPVEITNPKVKKITEMTNE